MKGKFLLVALVLALYSCGGRVPPQPALDESARASYSPPWPEAATAPYRGWDYLVEKLVGDGVRLDLLEAVFKDERMPPFTFVSFQLKPRESARMYSNFTKESVLKTGREFLKENEAAFAKAEKLFHVNRAVVAAIILIESNCGRITGKELVVNRLARVSSVNEPHNLDYNLELLQRTDPSVKAEQVQARGEYLELTFYPEMKALFKWAERDGIDLLSLKGSSAGAHGLPQFLPSSYLTYGADGNKDGKVSLFEPADAIWSAARFLAAFGWKDDARSTEKLKTLWHYNRSQAYGEAVLKVSILLGAPPKKAARSVTTKRGSRS